MESDMAGVQGNQTGATHCDDVQGKTLAPPALQPSLLTPLLWVPALRVVKLTPPTETATGLQLGRKLELPPRCWKNEVPSQQK